MRNKTLIFDVDDTILTTYDKDYAKSAPKTDIINKINHLYDKGYTIILYTARGFVSKNRNPVKIEKEVRPVLEKWLSLNNVKYHELILHKPFGALYIDDKSIRPNEFLQIEFE